MTGPSLLIVCRRNERASEEESEKQRERERERKREREGEGGARVKGGKKGVSESLRNKGNSKG